MPLPLPLPFVSFLIPGTLASNRCTSNMLGTCSYRERPRSLATSDDFCPTPPRINQGSSNPGGPLDDNDVYVAERLLRLSGDEFDTNDFFLRVQVIFCCLLIHEGSAPLVL